MKKQSAGLLLYRKNKKGVEVLLVHPGGPFWAKKDQGAWSIPKGEFVEGEEPLPAAKREFKEELGITPPEGETVELGFAKQPSGKVIYVRAIEADLDTKHVKSNLFDMEWPPKSGKTQTFPEADKAAWLTLPKASQKIVKGQLPFLERLAERLGVHAETPTNPSQASLF